MKNIIKNNKILITGFIIFLIIFLRYLFFLINVEIVLPTNLSVDYLSLITTIASIITSVAVFYYLPLLFIVEYRLNFNIKVNIKHNIDSTLNKVKSYNLIKNIYRINNVIRC